MTPPRAEPASTLAQAKELVRLARAVLQEDRVRRDRTSRAVVPTGTRARGVITAQAQGVLSGGEAAIAVARSLGLSVRRHRPDGSTVRTGQAVLTVDGDARSILAAERSMLNLLTHLSGVATATARAVRAARPVKVLATRKTLPGLRSLEKAAVVHGGGGTHRIDLADGILVKNNHLALVPVGLAIERVRAREGSGVRVQVEVRTLAGALRAARAGAEALLIDNASPPKARAIVRALDRAGLRQGRFLELSGGITPENAARYRRTGADALSIGALTHSAPALPFHLTVRPTRGPGRAA